MGDKKEIIFQSFRNKKLVTTKKVLNVKFLDKHGITNPNKVKLDTERPVIGGFTAFTKGQFRIWKVYLDLSTDLESHLVKGLDLIPEDTLAQYAEFKEHISDMGELKLEKTFVIYNEDREESLFLAKVEEGYKTYYFPIGRWGVGLIKLEEVKGRAIKAFRETRIKNLEELIGEAKKCIVSIDIDISSCLEGGGNFSLMPILHDHFVDSLY